MLTASPASFPASFLGVDSSATGRRWQLRAYNERNVAALTQRHGLPDLLARCLDARGIALDQAGSFLDPRLRDLLPDPHSFLDMDKAAQRFAAAIANGDPIAVFGDYDVDGATSSALLMRFARAAGVDIRLYVPDRIREGYGPNSDAMRRLASEGVRLVICVDCGTTAHAPLQAAAEAGLEVIVLDHHASEAVLPPAVAVVNPNRMDEKSDYTYLAAVGVTFLFVIAANRALRAAGHYRQRAEPDLMQWLDLVALGTICDVVKLVGLNRCLVAQGLKIAAQRRNAGLAALAAIAGARDMDAFAAGFMLGPRVNAGGRVGEASLGARLLATDDASIATSLAQRLHDLNAERRELEADVLRQVEHLTFADAAPLAFVAGDNWHPGVIGIVASRLKDRFQRPALVIALDGDIGKGSGRSIGAVDLGAAVIAAKQAGLLTHGGGHKMAAGFTIDRARLEAFRLFLTERFNEQLRCAPLSPVLNLDGMVGGPALTPLFAQEIGKLGPFGAGHSEPRFALADCQIARADIVGEKHVSIHIAQSGQRLRGIAFRAMESELGQMLLTQRRLHLAGYIRIDEWQGNQRVQMHISDAAVPA